MTKKTDDLDWQHEEEVTDISTKLLDEIGRTAKDQNITEPLKKKIAAATRFAKDGSLSKSQIDSIKIVRQLIEGEDLSEIAKQMGLSPATLRRTWHPGKMAMAKLMAVSAPAQIFFLFLKTLEEVHKILDLPNDQSNFANVKAQVFRQILMAMGLTSRESLISTMTDSKKSLQGAVEEARKLVSELQPVLDRENPEELLIREDDEELIH